MSDHTQQHEELLEEWFTGTDDFGADSRGAVPAQVAECDVCKGLIRELDAERSHLDAAGEDLRRMLAQVEQIDEAPGEDLVQEFFEDRLKPGFSVRRWTLPVGVAAALILLLGIFGSLDSGPPAQAPANLLGGGEAIRIAPKSPIGEVEGYGAFAWGGTLPPEWTAVIRVFDGAGGESIASSRPMASGPWTPSNRVSSEWPDRIRWEIQIRDASGDVRDSISATAWR